MLYFYEHIYLFIYLFIYYAFIRSIHMDIELVQVSINLQLQVGYKITT